MNSSDAISRNVQNGSVYHEYPPSRPFIHDDYRRDVTKPIIAYPESNRHGMICYECFFFNVSQLLLLRSTHVFVSIDAERCQLLTQLYSSLDQMIGLECVINR